MTTLSNFHDITTRIESARKAAPLAPARVELVAVAKTHPAEAMLPLLGAGHRLFGENKVQEAAGKWPALRQQFSDIALHLIGSLQSNKAREALDNFDVIETVDRPSLVDALVKARSEGRETRCREFYVQVNIGEEPQKGGVMPHDLGKLLDYMLTLRSSPLAALPVTGLMCVPPAGENPAPYFALLHKMAKEHGLDKLSMGMSGDYETAIRFGATCVRIGTAIFGDRE